MCATKICPKCHRDAPVEHFHRRGIGGAVHAVGICCLPAEKRTVGMTVTEHAIDRYIERVADVDRATADAAIREIAVTGTWSRAAPEWTDGYPTKAGYVTFGDICLPLKGVTGHRRIKTVLTYDPAEIARNNVRVSHRPYRQLERHLQGRYLHADEEFVNADGICPVQVWENGHQHAFLTFRADTPAADDILETMRTWADQLDRPLIVDGPESLLDRHPWLDTLDAERAIPVVKRPGRDVPAGAIGYVPDGWAQLRRELSGYLGWDGDAALPVRVPFRRSGRPQLVSA